MGVGTPRAHPVALLLIASLVSMQAVARYKGGFLAGKEWQAVHILIGWTLALGVLVLFHGRAILERFDRRALWILGGGSVSFCLFWYFGRVNAWQRYWAQHVDPGGAWEPVYAFLYFSAGGLLFRILIPFGGARLLFRWRPGELGLFAPTNPHPPALRRIWPVYVLLFLIVLPFMLKLAGTPAFLAKYPLCRGMLQPDGSVELGHLVVAQVAYLLVFVSGEAFWRGFLVFGLERQLGAYAIALMIVPYVTGHFGKPLPETLGAIVAGSVLGWLALKHRSVWLGVALHYAVALTMDLLALRAGGYHIG